MEVSSKVSGNQICLTLKSDSLSPVEEEEESSLKVNPLPVTVIHSRKDDKQAWIVCVAACLVQTLIIGVNHSFGVFYVEFLDEFHCSKGVAGMPWRNR
jgi:hypothetical protein